MLSRKRILKLCLVIVCLIGVIGLMSMGNSPGRGNTTASPEAENTITRYVDLERTGELERRERIFWEKMEYCTLCPHRCGVNRMAGEKGICSSDDTLIVASFGPHFGEERPLVGRRGSGTIFFSNCNLLCVFCINYDVAHLGHGSPTTVEALASMMLSLQRQGCHNINLVSPTHVLPFIISALRIAIPHGLNAPLVFNSSGFECLEVIKLLDGIVDIYLPDFKFQDCEIAYVFAPGARNYTVYAAAAIAEMHRQVGNLHVVNGIAQRGLIIRHLVLPENLAGTDAFVRWVADELGTDTHVNIMSQYRPMFRAFEHPPLDRRLIRGEFEQAMRWARDAGLRNFH
jgi:putative pyruvate formate lyase activating enzyme